MKENRQRLAIGKIVKGKKTITLANGTILEEPTEIELAVEEALKLMAEAPVENVEKKVEVTITVTETVLPPAPKEQSKWATIPEKDIHEYSETYFKKEPAPWYKKLFRRK